MTAPASTLPPGLLASWLPRAVDAHAIVAVTDAAGVIRYANDAFTALSGYSREELIGKTHALIKSGEHPPEFYAQLWQTIRRGEVWHGTFCNRVVLRSTKLICIRNDSRSRRAQSISPERSE